MPTSKNLTMNGKEATLVDFFTQIYPQRFMKALKVLLNLKYPIADQNTFRKAVEKIETDDYVQRWILNYFQPSDFGLNTPMNALEKFYFRYTRKTAFEQLEHQQTETFTTYPTNGYPTQNQQLLKLNGTPTNGNLYYQNPNNGFDQQIRQDRVQQHQRGQSFGNDAFGRAAETAWLEFVLQGWQVDNAYQTVHQRVRQGRELMPDYGDGWIAQKAQTVFANQYVVFGKSQYLADQAARRLVNQLRRRNLTRTNPVPTENGSLVEQFENELIYN